MNNNPAASLRLCVENSRCIKISLHPQKNYVYLIGEQIKRLEAEIEADNKMINEIDGKRSVLIRAQNAKTAFDEYNALQENLREKTGELMVKEDCLERYDKTATDLEANTDKKNELVDAAKAQYETLRPTWEAEEKFFADFIAGLYSDVKTATLGISIDNGDDFGIHYKPCFDSDRSMGRRKLKTLGFDLTLFHHQRENDKSIDFMIHDSVLYESSDSRQFANALKFIDGLCRKEKSQYITVLNSDDAQTDDFTSVIKFKDLKERFVKNRILSDSGTDGKLLGIDF